MAFFLLTFLCGILWFLLVAIGCIDIHTPHTNRSYLNFGPSSKKINKYFMKMCFKFKKVKTKTKKKSIVLCFPQNWAVEAGSGSIGFFTLIEPLITPLQNLLEK